MESRCVSRSAHSQTDDMLHTQLVKLAGHQTSSGATDDGSAIRYPRARFVPAPLFSAKPPSPVVPVSRNHEMVRRFRFAVDPPVEGLLVDLLSFRQLFRLHARGQDGISLSYSDRWLRQAGCLHSPDTAIYFKQVAKYKKTLPFSAYQTFLELLAKKKNLDVNEMKYKMAICGPPATYKTTEIDNRRTVLVSERRHRRKKKEGFFSNCQCRHGYNSQISYSFFPETEEVAETEDWFPEE